MILRQLVKELNIIESNVDFDTDISSICYDSRKAEKGSLFIAIKGFETDGHKYIPKAADLGCYAAVCETKPEISIPYILVEDSRLALALMSCAFFDNPSKKMTVIGVTGTSGKTTTTQLIKHVLETSLNVKIGLIGTNGNFIGDTEYHTEHTTPESFELQSLLNDMYQQGCSYVVMEVSSHALALSRVAGVHFRIAAFTNISQDHLDFHKDMDDYASAKKALFSMCDIACINLDDRYSDFMLSGLNCEVFTTSVNSKADVTASDVTVGHDGVYFLANFNNQTERFHLSIPGSFSVYNALTVISVCINLGIGFMSVKYSLASASGVKGRMESVCTDGDYSIIIDYSHKPDPLEKVLKTLKSITRGRLIVLFGCGGDRDKAKRPIMGKIAVDNADFVIVTSDNPRTEDPLEIIREILEGIKDTSTPYIVIPDRVEAIRWAVDNVLDGDVILLAGKGHEDYQVIGHDKYHMDEREIVSDYLREKSK